MLFRLITKYKMLYEKRAILKPISRIIDVKLSEHVPTLVVGISRIPISRKNKKRYSDSTDLVKEHSNNQAVIIISAETLLPH